MDKTSIVSHATARPSSDPATAVLQIQAKRWMGEQRSNYDLVRPKRTLLHGLSGASFATVALSSSPCPGRAIDFSPGQDSASPGELGRRPG